MTITQLIKGLAPWNYFHSIENKIVVKIKTERDTRLQKKKSNRARFFLQPPFLFIFGLKGLNFELLNI